MERILYPKINSKMITTTTKKIWIILTLSSVLLLAWCWVINKEDDVLTDTWTNNTSDVTVEQNLTWTVEGNTTWEVVNKEIDSALEQKVDKLIEDHKKETESGNTSWLTEKDVDLINNVINEITDSLDTWTKK